MESNFYEVLEIPPDASEHYIERAYRIARSTYRPASPATYSIFDDGENADILRRIEEAYSILSDARLRREYDARLRREPAPAPRPRAVLPPLRAPAPGLEESTADAPTPAPYIEEDGRPELPAPEARPSAAEYPLPWSGPPSETQGDEAAPEIAFSEPRPLPESAPPQDEAPSLEPESEPAEAAEPAEAGPLEEVAALEEGVYDGRALRATRLHLGIDLEEIAEATKIGGHYLRLIEANRYVDLPAAVYLRGFLREFAKALRLEPGLVVESYMEQCEELRGRD